MQHGKDVSKSLNKAAPFGEDVDLNKFGTGDGDPKAFDDLKNVPYKDAMEDVGVTVNEDNRAGTIMFINNSISHCSNKEEEGVEIMSTKDALAKYDWLQEYNWKMVDPEKDKYTAKTYVEESDGYFIHVKAGYHAKNPIQTCMLIDRNKSIQNLHNIIIVEEGGSLEIITGCTTESHASESLHVGVSEIYIKDNGSLQFSMIHNWGKETSVRPRTAIDIGKNGKYVNNYVLLNPVGTMQSNPVAYLNGEGASAVMNTVILSHDGSEVDSGGTVYLNAKGTSAEIMSRSITTGGKMIARGKLVGNATGAKAHLECRSLVLEDGGLTLAIPELESTVADVEMTHEAAVGKIARDQIEYLMSRGLDEDAAIGMIVKGFLAGSINGLPDHLRKEIDMAIEKANLGS